MVRREHDTVHCVLCMYGLYCMRMVFTPNTMGDIYPRKNYRWITVAFSNRALLAVLLNTLLQLYSCIRTNAASCGIF